MKLLYCGKCWDVFKLDFEERTCKCGATKGRYIDELNAEYSGEEAYPIGFDNYDLLRALNGQPESGWGERFEAFVIPKECPTMTNLTNHSDGSE